MKYVDSLEMHRLFHYLKKNWLSLLGIVLALAGLYLSIVFYEKSQRQREPIFVKQTHRPKLIDLAAFEKTQLSVVKPDGCEITNDLYKVYFYFWNNGKEAIRPENILSDIVISLQDSSSEIVSFSIIDSSRAIANFQLHPVQEGRPIRDLHVSFDIVEYQDGFVGELLYVGSPNAPLNIEGIIEGAGEIGSEVTISTGMIVSSFAYHSLIMLLGAFGIVVIFLPVWYVCHVARKCIRRGVYLVVDFYGREWYRLVRIGIRRSLISILILCVVIGIPYCVTADVQNRSTFESMPSKIKPTPVERTPRGAWY